MKNLKIYQKALNSIIKIYGLIKENPILAKDFSLCDQIKRAAVSVLTNIAEGYYRSRKQSQNYLQISSGSTNEVVALLDIISTIYGIDTNELREEYLLLGKQINAFSRSLPEN